MEMNVTDGSFCISLGHRVKDPRALCKEAKGLQSWVRRLEQETLNGHSRSCTGCHMVSLLGDESCMVCVSTEMVPGWSSSCTGFRGDWKDGSPTPRSERCSAKVCYMATCVLQCTCLCSLLCPKQGVCAGWLGPGRVGSRTLLIPGVPPA